MPAFDFNLDLAALLSGALKVVVILVIALIVVLITRRVIPRLITARIPKIREEAPEQLPVRSKTLSQVIV